MVMMLILLVHYVNEKINNFISLHILQTMKISGIFQIAFSVGVTGSTLYSILKALVENSTFFDLSEPFFISLLNFSKTHLWSLFVIIHCGIYVLLFGLSWEWCWPLPIFCLVHWASFGMWFPYVFSCNWPCLLYYCHWVHVQSCNWLALVFIIRFSNNIHLGLN